MKSRSDGGGENLMRGMDALRARGWEYETEHRLRRRDDQYRHMLPRATPIIGGDRAIREWVGVHTDVTEQRRLQVQLDAERIRLRDIFMQAPAFIATVRGPRRR